jgi:hypothetical protein
MPTITCLGCSHPTNTAACDWLDHPDFQPRHCYLRFGPTGLAKGCGYNVAPPHIKAFIDRILTTRATQEAPDTSTAPHSDVES